MFQTYASPKSFALNFWLHEQLCYVFMFSVSARSISVQNETSPLLLEFDELFV